MFDRPKLLLFDIRRLIIALIYVPGLVDVELIVVHHLDLLRGGRGGSNLVLNMLRWRRNVIPGCWLFGLH